MFNSRFWSDASFVLLLCIAPLSGAAKCWFLALRPGVNKKCVWSLMFSLVAIYTFAFASALGPTPSTALDVFPYIVSSLLALSARPLAVAGLIEYGRHKGAYTRGRVCAICGLFVSLGIFWKQNTPPTPNPPSPTAQNSLAPSRPLRLCGKTFSGPPQIPQIALDNVVICNIMFPCWPQLNRPCSRSRGRNSGFRRQAHAAALRHRSGLR